MSGRSLPSAFGGGTGLRNYDAGVRRQAREGAGSPAGGAAGYARGAYGGNTLGEPAGYDAGVYRRSRGRRASGGYAREAYGGSAYGGSAYGGSALVPSSAPPSSFGARQLGSARQGGDAWAEADYLSQEVRALEVELDRAVFAAEEARKEAGQAKAFFFIFSTFISLVVLLSSK